MVILMFADKSEQMLQNKVKQSLIDNKVNTEDLILPVKIARTDNMNYFLIQTKL